MTLRSKLFALFGLLGAAPLVLVGIFGYLRSLDAVDTEENLLPRCTPDLTSGCNQPLAGPCFVTGDCPGGTLTLDDEGLVATLDPLLDLGMGDHVLRI